MESIKSSQEYYPSDIIDTSNRSTSRSNNWSHEETKELLRIRGDLDQTFLQTKNYKLLWEIISAKMREKGFNLTTDQCKCKWNNLIMLYKQESKTMEIVDINMLQQQQFPYFEELHLILTTRIKLISWVFEANDEAVDNKGSENKRLKLFFLEEEEEEFKINYDGYEKSSKRKRRSNKKYYRNSNSKNSDGNKLMEILKDFMKQQMDRVKHWQDVMIARKEERRLKEMEWQREMEALERKRLMMEIRLKKREEQRFIREEEREKKRDALITLLLENLRNDEVNHEQIGQVH